MSNLTEARLEWENLKHGERNCLLWPDFLEWSDVENREIKRKELTDELGIISVVVQDPRNKVCFNIIKEIIERKPASKKVNCFEWIVAVDGKSTTKVKGSDELVNLIKNGKDRVQMSIRKAIDPLENIRAWSEEEIRLKLNLEQNSKDLGFRLAHFYSKAKKDEDRILIFEVKSGKSLIRGDELIAVDDTDVKGKKLEDIYDLIEKHSKPTLSIRKILTKKEFEEKLRRTAVKEPDKIYWNKLLKVTRSVQKANEPSLGFVLTSGRSSTSGETFHVISHVKEQSPASHANLSVGDRLMSVNGVPLRNEGKKAVEDLIKNQCMHSELMIELWPPEGLKLAYQSKRPSLRRRSLRRISSEHSTKLRSSSKRENVPRSSSSMQAQSNTETTSGAMSSDESLDQLESNPKDTDGKKQLILKKKQFSHQENAAYYSSGVVHVGDEPAKHKMSKPKSLPRDNVLMCLNMNDADLCEWCHQKQIPKLPEDKLLWPINKVEHNSYDEICRDLDIDYGIYNNSRFAGCLGLSTKDIHLIKQKFYLVGGVGATHEYLKMWSCVNKESNIGGIREICQSEHFRNVDVVRLIDEWTKKDVCFGCGRLLSRK